ncbi:MAG: hypothetical protein Q7J15_04740 [Candidatus Desulfaltia sp.]|nr:hypothetical protein [Candidatus Desulfaltia sp.]
MSRQKLKTSGNRQVDADTSTSRSKGSAERVLEGYYNVYIRAHGSYCPFLLTYCPVLLII